MADFPDVATMIGTPNTVDWKEMLEALILTAMQLPGAQAAETQTIADGVITPTRCAVLVGTQSGDSADDLSTILGTELPDGSRLELRAAYSDRVVTVKHGAGGAGQVHLLGDADRTLDPDRVLTLTRIGADWYELEPNLAVAHMLAALGAQPARNKIRNSNFSVNQRGLTGSISKSAGESCHDGYKAGSSGVTYTAATVDGITTITITAGSLVQVIPGADIDSGIHTLGWEGDATGRINSGSYGASGAVQASLTGGASATVEWTVGSVSKVRLTEGVVDAGWVKPNYARELKRCLDYVWQIESGATNPTNQTIGFAQGLFTTTADMPIRIPDGMDPSSIAVSVSALSDIMLIEDKAGGANVTPTAITVATNGACTGMANIRFSGTFVVRSQYLVRFADTGWLRLSAEL
ncbi:MAG: hypothetical protein AB7E51_06740 [Pseudodesulfovibrio sp.]|uniref:hypothetical protein n=1 Tax=Pseudodesulfovibrio sp. TaxID=2035812 RepID=UPI003D0A1F6E